jgi:hypothetical protein
MEQLLRQAPANISNEEIERIFNENNNDFNKTLLALWEIDDNNNNNNDDNDDKKINWTFIRDTCDAYDTEMKKMMDSNRR